MLTLQSIQLCLHQEKTDELRLIGSKLSRAVKKACGVENDLPLLPYNTDLYFFSLLCQYHQKYGPISQGHAFLDFLSIEYSIISPPSEDPSEGSLLGLIRQQLRSVLRAIKSLLLNQRKVPTARPSDVIFHYAAVMRGDSLVCPNLFGKHLSPGRVNSKLRNKFIRSLIDDGFDGDLALCVANIFPVSMLEQLSQVLAVARHYNPKTVYTNLGGLLRDPVLLAIAATGKPNVYFVQHGGGYCFCRPFHIKIEEDSGASMLYWGLGDNNIQQTRFPCLKYENLMPCTFKALLVLRHDATSDFVFSILDVLSRVANECAIKCELIISIHPRSVEAFDYCVPPESTYFQVDLQIGIAESLDKFGLVILDSIHHTTIYERIFMHLPYLVLSDIDSLNPQVMAPNAKEFANSLASEGIYLNATQLGSAMIKFLSTPWLDYLVAFRRKTQSPHSFMFAPPSIYQHFFQQG